MKNKCYIENRVDITQGMDLIVYFQDHVKIYTQDKFFGVQQIKEECMNPFDFKKHIFNGNFTFSLN